jgi:hypothetical protein
MGKNICKKPAEDSKNPILVENDKYGRRSESHACPPAIRRLFRHASLDAKAPRLNFRAPIPTANSTCVARWIKAETGEEQRSGGERAYCDKIARPH